MAAFACKNIIDN